MEEQKVSIIYEDAKILVLSKPSGMHSAMTMESRDNSVSQFISTILPDASTISDNALDNGLINRLDYQTSGLLIAAKSRESWLALREIQSSGKMEKGYLALVEGHFPAQQGVSSWIGSPYRHAKKVHVYISKPGKKARALAAESNFTLIKYIKEMDASLVQAVLHTGRRHQIRAHASFLKHPLIGDTLYASSRTMHDIFHNQLDESGSLPEFFLHASSMIFPHPLASSAKVSFQAPIPHPFDEFMP